MPLSLRDQVDRGLDRLADAPVTVSVRSAFPYRPDRQVYHFSATDFLGKRWHFTIHFRYGQDEQTLYVVAFVVAEPAN